MSNAVSQANVSAKVAAFKREDAQRLFNALRAGRVVAIECGFNFEDGTFRVRGEVDGARISFPVDESVAGRAELCCRRLDKPAARQQIANIALDVFNPEGRDCRIANGYPGII
jgi:hypothetical protein